MRISSSKTRSWEQKHKEKYVNMAQHVESPSFAEINISGRLSGFEEQIIHRSYKKMGKNMRVAVIETLH